MTYPAMARESLSVQERSRRFFTASSDELTISYQFIQHLTPPYYYGYGPVDVPLLDWPLVSGDVECGWLPFVEKQLDAIAALRDGWDSYGASRPDVRLIDAARGLIRCLAQADKLPQPHVNPTRNGGVQFEWETAARYFELEIVAERAAEYFYCDSAEHIEDAGTLFEDELLGQVLAYIQSVVSSQ